MRTNRRMSVALVVGLAGAACGPSAADTPSPLPTATGFPDTTTIAGAGPTASPPPATPSAPPSLATGSTTHTVGGVTLILPPGFVVDDPVDEGIGFRPETPLLTARSDAGDGWASFRFGPLKAASGNGEPATIADGVVNDYFAPLLGDVGILGATGRQLAVAGAQAHETVIVSNPAPDGSLLYVDFLIVPHGSGSYYLELVTGLASGAELPEGVFLPAMGAIAESIDMP